MAKRYCYDYPRPAVTVDVVAFAIRAGALCVLLIRRGRDPFAGLLAMPGGFLEMDESPEAGALRELREETGLELDDPISPLGFYGAPGRDPRGRTITLAFASACREGGGEPRGSDDASDASWFPVSLAGPFAFDHQQMLADGLAWLARGVESGPLGLALLSPESDSDTAAHLFETLGLGRDTAARWVRRGLRSGSLASLRGRPGRFRVLDPS